MTQRLALSDDLYPLAAFFNRLTSAQFEQALNSFASGRGYNLENLTCQFPADLYEVDQAPISSFDYIEFWTYSGNQEARVGFNDFLIYLREAVAVENAENGSKDLDALYQMVETQVKQLEQAMLAG
jgi:hypothetical protein